MQTERRRYNELLLNEQPRSIVSIMAVNEVIDSKRSLDKSTMQNIWRAQYSEDDKRDLKTRLDIAIGCPVRINRNLCTSAGLCNGTPGLVVDIWYTNPGLPPSKHLSREE